MKSIEEIENTSFEELERIAQDSSVRVPEDLQAGILSALTAANMSTRKSRKTPIWIGAAALSAALASLAIVVNVASQPKDTFSDPMLAYAELERSFALISKKMDKGMDLAAQAQPAFNKTTKTINRLK